ncbi:MAG: hypothetical protein GY714_01200 [Desulfobacterales bacterium]|nr:hypothetical protein [Desulfobacterales bacterium]MCP4161359.1 hypothetical protein [Deltaproteobacteria bacterium]
MKKNIVVCIIILLLIIPSISFGSGLIKIFKNDSKYYVAPVESILYIKYQSRDKTLIINFYDKMKSVLIRDILNEEADKLIQKIYNPNRKKTLLIEVDVFK